MLTVQSLAETILFPLNLHTDLYQVEIIKQRVIAYRQQLLQQDFSRYGRYNEQTVQAFDVQLIEVQEDEDRFYVSEILPKPIISARKIPFISVHTAYKGRTKKPLGYLLPEEVPYIEHRKFTKKADFFTYENDRIISYGKAPVIRIRAVWDDPIAAYEFASLETYKLECSKETITSPCYNGVDILLEETLAARILTFFNPNQRRNANTSEEDNG